MTRERLLELLLTADTVYVVVEVRRGNPFRVLVDPDELREQIIAEGEIFLDDDLVVPEEDFRGDDLVVAEEADGLVLVVGGEQAVESPPAPGYPS